MNEPTTSPALARRAQLQAEVDARYAEMETLQNAANLETIERGLTALVAAGAWLEVEFSADSSLKAQFTLDKTADFASFYALFGFTGYHDSIDADTPTVNIAIEADDGLLRLIVWHNRHHTTNETTWPADLAAAKRYIASRGFRLITTPLERERDNYRRIADGLQTAITAIQAP